MSGPSQGVLEHQASYERLYQTSGLRDQQRFYRWVLRVLRPLAGARVLDVACGEGGILVEGARLPIAVWGVDISHHAAAKVRAQQPAAGVLVGNAETLPFLSRSFDYVTCLGSLENFADPLQAMTEVHRVLRDDGVFCAMMPNKYWLGDVLQVWAGADEQVPFQRVERVATVRQWRRLLEYGGFRVERVHGFVKRSPLMRDSKIRSLRKFLTTNLLALICPVALAWSVLYICRKSPAGAGAAPDGAWVWRAEWARVGRPSLS